MDIPSYLIGKKSGGGKGATIEVVTELPEIGESNVIYLVPKQDTGDNDVFDEYLYVNDEWELIGTTDIDLSNYYTKSEVDGKLPPIYVLNTTNQLNDSSGSQYFGNDEKVQMSTILTDAYAKGHKSIAILLCSTTSGKAYMFFSDSVISTNGYPYFYADTTFRGRNDTSRIVKRYFYATGSWNNNVFTANGNFLYDVSQVPYLTPNNAVAYDVTNNYNPAHKKYVDDSIAAAITTTLGGSF